MTVNISVTFSTIIPDILRHLSVLGKRTTNRQGENTFASVTLSSAETPIITQYLQQASQNVVAAIQQFVSMYTESDTAVTFRVINTRWNDPYTPSFSEAFEPSFHKYLVMYALAEYLSMNFPDYAKKYYDAATQAIQAIIRLVYFKAPPATSSAEPPSADVTPQAIFQTSVIAGVTPTRYEFVIPLMFVINTIERWGDVTITHISEGEEGESSMTLLRDNGVSGLFTSGNTFSGHKVIADTNLDYLKTNANAIGANIRIRLTDNSTDTMVLSWSEE